MSYDLEPIEESDLDLESRFNNSKQKDSLRPQEKVSQPEVRKEGAVETAQTEKDSLYSKTLSQVQSNKDDTATDMATVAQDASDVHQQMDRESQIQHLVDLAVTKGVVHAVKVAEHAQDYYVLDRVHDQLLTDDFRSALRDRNLE